MTPWKIFYSYSSEDKDLRHKLANHLAQLERKGLLQTWYDRQIPAGDDWDHAIQDKLESADLIIALISSDFLASEYCFQVEMKRAFERVKAGAARLAPVLLRACHWQESIFSGVQCLPRDGKALTSWSNLDEAFAAVAAEIAAIVKGPLPATTQSTMKPATGADLTIVREQIGAYGRLYERTRQIMKASSDRTFKMQEIFESMRSLATASFPMLHELADSPLPGDKLAALSILQVFATVDYLPFLVNTIEREKPFAGYQAAIALNFAVSALDPIHHEKLKDAIDAAVAAMKRSDPASDSDRMKKLRKAQQSLAAVKAAFAQSAGHRD